MCCVVVVAATVTTVAITAMIAVAHAARTHTHQAVAMMLHRVLK